MAVTSAMPPTTSSGTGWGNLSFGYSLNGSGANSPNTGSGATSSFSSWTGFDFSAVGDNDTVTQIVVKVTARYQSRVGLIRQLQLLKAGVAVGTPQDSTNLTASYVEYTFTFSGLTWTGAELKSATSGCTFAFKRVVSKGLGGLGVDFVSLTATYTPAAPTVTSNSASGQISAAFSYQITATGSPTLYGATDLPSGLSVNTTTGLVTGNPTQSGSFSVSLSATNAGGTGTGTLTLVIAPAPSTSSLQPMMAMHSQHNTFAHQF